MLGANKDLTLNFVNFLQVHKSFTETTLCYWAIFHFPHGIHINPHPP